MQIATLPPGNSSFGHCRRRDWEYRTTQGSCATRLDVPSHGARNCRQVDGVDQDLTLYITAVKPGPLHIRTIDGPSGDQLAHERTGVEQFITDRLSELGDVYCVTLYERMSGIERFYTASVYFKVWHDKPASRTFQKSILAGENTTIEYISDARNRFFWNVEKKRRPQWVKDSAGMWISRSTFRRHAKAAAELDDHEQEDSP